MPHELSPGASGHVVVRLDMDAVFDSVSEVVIRNISRDPVDETRIPQPQIEVEVPVSGGAFDTYIVTIRDTEGGEFVPQFELRSPNDGGNLVLRVSPVTIDPDTDVVLVNATQGTRDHSVPEDRRNEGGVELSVPRRGDRSVWPACGLSRRPRLGSHRHSRRAHRRAQRRNRPRASQVIAVPVPPLDEPSFNLGMIDGDTTPPRVIASPELLRNFDPVVRVVVHVLRGHLRGSLGLGTVELRTLAGVRVPGEGAICPRKIRC